MLVGFWFLFVVASALLSALLITSKRYIDLRCRYWELRKDYGALVERLESRYYAD